MKGMIFIAILATISISATSCDETTRPDFIMAIADEHVSLDPQKISWGVDVRIADCLYEGLVRYKTPSLELEPGVAERWEISDDGLTYTFHLRQNSKWSNGDPVTAHDFIYAWQRAILPSTAADYTQLLFHIDGAKEFFDWRTDQLAQFVTKDNHHNRSNAALNLWNETQSYFTQTVGLTATDDHTLVVRLKTPTAYFLEMCAFVTFFPVHKNSLETTIYLDEESGSIRHNSRYWVDPDQLVTNGPYILKRRRFKRDLLLIANDYYWNRASMKNKSILEKIIPEKQTALLAYDRGEVDWLPELPTASEMAADLAASSRKDVHLQPMAGVYFYNFNCNPKLNDGSPNLLSDRRIRRAMAMTIDKKTIVTQVTRLNQPTTKTLVPTGAVDGYAPPADAGINFDPEAARALLVTAGYPDGKNIDGLSILYNSGQGHEKIAQSLKRMWQKYLGIVVTLEGVEVKTFSDRLKKHDFTISRASWYGDYRDPTTWLDLCRTDNGNNDRGYSNAAYDTLLDNATVEIDPVKRFSILRKAEAMMIADAPFALIYQYIQLYVYDEDRISGLTPNAWNNWRLEFVKVDPIHLD